MTRISYCTAAAIFCVSSICSGAVDFTPRYCDILADGVAIHSLYLQDGPKRVFLRAPLGWEVKSEGGAMCVTSPAHGAARVDIRQSAIKLPAAPDEKWIKMISPQLLKSLPGGAKNSAVVETKANPIALNSWDSFEFRMSYELADVKYLRSVVFITLVDGQSMEMVTGGVDADLGPARAAGFSLLGTWQEPPVKVMSRMLQ